MNYAYSKPAHVLIKTCTKSTSMGSKVSVATLPPYVPYIDEWHSRPQHSSRQYCGPSVGRICLSFSRVALGGVNPSGSPHPRFVIWDYLPSVHADFLSALQGLPATRGRLPLTQMWRVWLDADCLWPSFDGEQLIGCDSFFVTAFR